MSEALEKRFELNARSSAIRFLLALALSVLIYAALLSRVWDFVIDDAYISLRYAQNWANGHGPRFNVGEPPVEGYTNFLLVAVEAIMFRLGVVSSGTVLDAVRLFCVGCGLVTLTAIVAFALPRVGIWGAVLGGLFVASSVPFVAWTTGGLETTVAVMWVTLGTVAFLSRWEPKGRQWSGWAPFFFALGVLTRPDVVFFYLVTLLWIGFEKIATRKTKRWEVTGAAASLCMLGIYGAWKWAFYGALIPATALAKETKRELITFLGGARRLWLFFSFDFNFVMLLIAAVGLALLAVWRLRAARSAFPAPCIYLLLLGGSFAIYLCSLGYSVSMDDTWRLHVPLISLLVLLGATVSFLCRKEQPSFRLPKFVQITTFVGCVALLLGVRTRNLVHFWETDMNFGAMPYRASAQASAKGLPRGHIAAGLWLRAHAHPGEVLVCHDAGAMPFFSQLQTVDIWSLNDRFIIGLHREFAGRRGATQFRRRLQSYLLRKNPTWVVKGQDGGLLSDPATAHAFEYVATFFYLHDYPLHLYRRKIEAGQLSRRGGGI